MNDNEMLEWVEFVTDKFAANHEPWKYRGYNDKLKHIRYESDYTGHNRIDKRLKRFLKNITVDYIRPTKLSRALGMNRISWFIQVHISWNIYVIKDKNLPDATVNGIIAHWDEDAEYITMFCPYVGREVLKFLRDRPQDEHAQNILSAMRETQELSWPKGDTE